MTYFTPDRSNRPESTSDIKGRSTEFGSGQPITVNLNDGRTAVHEAVNVDGINMVYYYFDTTDLEDATTDELQELLVQSGIDLQPPDDETDVSTSTTKKEDAQQRPIWEFQITYY